MLEYNFYCAAAAHHAAPHDEVALDGPSGIICRYRSGECCAAELRGRRLPSLPTPRIRKMNPFMRCLILACVTITTACAAVGVVSTRDPLTKLNDAAVLYGRKDRPLPAERLIQEGIAIYQREDDAHGLGIAYREYGDLLRSAAVVNWEGEYRRDGFLDRSINFDNRLEKAKEFYRKALESLEQGAKQRESAGQYDVLSNVYYNMAWSHLALGETSQACEDFDRALGAYAENVRRNPAAKPMHSPAFGNASEEIGYRKRQAGCPSP